MKNGILMGLLLTGFTCLNAQNWTDAEMLDRQNYGLKLGFNITSMWGGELQNPRPYFGPTAGFFWHTKETKKPFMFQTGFEGSLRGSNFANKSTDFPGGGNTNYRRLGLITADLPLLINYRLGPKKKTAPGLFRQGRWSLPPSKARFIWVKINCPPSIFWIVPVISTNGIICL